MALDVVAIMNNIIEVISSASFNLWVISLFSGTAGALIITLINQWLKKPTLALSIKLIEKKNNQIQSGILTIENIGDRAIDKIILKGTMIRDVEKEGKSTDKKPKPMPLFGIKKGDKLEPSNYIVKVIDMVLAPGNNFSILVGNFQTSFKEKIKMVITYEYKFWCFSCRKEIIPHFKLSEFLNEHKNNAILYDLEN